jgi:crotonobetainyl-CoA:carnitine CoA-transferase CaiB-like acyl-CoA transferase
MSGPLEGIRVLDLADEKALPCAKLLADMGADVIKVEPPQGDATRRRPPFAGDIVHPERSLYFLHHNANKRGITLNLEVEEGQALFRRLAASADIVVETFRPGAMAGWGLGYEALAKVNPGIVVTSVTLFGQTGPFRDYRGGELVAFAMGGLMALSGEPGGPPCVAPGELSCGVASMHAALANEVALFHRKRSGRGQHVDVAVAEAAVHAGSYTVPLYSYTKKKPRRATHIGHGPEIQHDLFRCKDGWVRLYLINRRHWPAFVEWMGSPPELADPELAAAHVRSEHMGRIAPILDQLCSQFSKREIYLQGEDHHLAVTPVNTPGEFVDSEQTRSRGFFQEVEHPVIGKYRQIGAMHKFSATPTQMRCAAPLLGQHNADVYQGELGLSVEDMRDLKTRGVL